MTRFEQEAGGLVVSRQDGCGWQVTHAPSGAVAFPGWLRQRRFAEEARAELLATGVDFTRPVRDVSADRKRWSKVYFRWAERARSENIDPDTWEYYGTSLHYGQFIPSARWAADMRAACAAGDYAAIERLLTPRNARSSVQRTAPENLVVREQAAPATPPTRVIFRKWYRQQDGTGVIALFPDDAWNRSGMCASYEHVGQHGGADLAGVISRTKPASPDEYAALKRELERPPYDYVLTVIRRSPHRTGDRA
jgi:hypothetical protein